MWNNGDLQAFQLVVVLILVFLLLIRYLHRRFSFVMACLRNFKSIIVPLFFVAEGALRWRAESFNLGRMNRLHGELFVKCWKHNLRWMPTLLEEYSEMCMKDSMKRYGLSFIASRGIMHVDHLLSRCQREYDYDLKEMIEDVRKGRINVTPRPLRALHQLDGIVRSIRHSNSGRTSGRKLQTAYDSYSAGPRISRDALGREGC